MRNYRLAIMMAVLGLAASSVFAAGHDELGAYRRTGTLRIGTTGDYPPFSYRDPASGRYIGSDIEQGEAFARSLKLRAVWVQTSWQGLLDDQRSGRFDLAMGGISITAERQAQALFSHPYLTDGKTPLARCAEQARFQTLQQLDRPEVRVIVNPGGTNERFVRQQLPHAALQVYGDNLGVFDELLAGRADVMVTDAVEARLQQRLRPGLCAVHPDRPFDRSEKAYLVARDPALQGALDRWLARSIRSGKADKALQRWLDHAWPTMHTSDAATPARALARLIDERLALMPDVARYKWNAGTAIEDLPRERLLVESIRVQAGQYGLAPDRAAAFFSAQIEASKVIQRELFTHWQQQGQAKFATVRDLATDIRPALDALNPRLLAALAAVPDPVGREALGNLPATATSPAAVAVAVAPLLQASP